MITLHIFGKSSGCAKCAVLKKRVAAAVTEEKNRDKFCVDFHDLLTVEGLADFCKANINPNRVPALIAGNEDGYLPSRWGPDDPLTDKSLLYPYMGICTDYSEEGHRGIITAEMIQRLMEDAQNDH